MGDPNVTAVLISFTQMYSQGLYVTNVAPAVAANIRLDSARMFTENLRASVNFQMADETMTSTSSIVYSYGIRRLPAIPMMARPSAPGIGYFTTVYHDLGLHGDLDLPNASPAMK